MVRNRDMPPLPPKAPEQSGVDMPLVPDAPQELSSGFKAPVVEGHPLKKPDMRQQEANNTVEITKISPRGIDVVATRPGWMQNNRVDTGTQFTVPSMSKLGEWMRCVDPEMEKKRVAMINERKRPAGAPIPQE